MAETYEVRVRARAFGPNELTIDPGDTVIWIYAPGNPCGPYGCSIPAQHTVTADDGTWSSGQPSDGFSFAKTFDSPGDNPYHCAVHSTPGQDIDNNMNGLVTVREVEPQFTINHGINDAWFNPATAGQGFFIIVFPDIPLIFLAWFTYDTERPDEDVIAILGEAGHRWITAQGGFQGDTATLDVFLTAGGVFDSVEPAPDPAVKIGTMTIVWADCENAILSYDIPDLGLMGEVPLERIALDNVALCEQLGSP